MMYWQHKHADGVDYSFSETQPGSEWTPSPDAPSKGLENMVRTERDRMLREIYDPAVNQIRRKIDIAQKAGEINRASSLREELFSWYAYANKLETLPDQEGFPWGGPDDENTPWPVSPNATEVENV